MDYDYYVIRALGWLPALVVLMLGFVVAVWKGHLTRRGRWCLAIAIVLQCSNVLFLRMAKDAANKLMAPSPVTLTARVTNLATRSPSNSFPPYPRPPYLGEGFSFNQSPVDDPIRRNYGLLPYIESVSLYNPPQDWEWKQFHTRRRNWTICDNLPDSLLTALIWGLVFFAVYDRPALPKFLVEDAETDEETGDRS
jgi:hypothetical protein